MKTLKREASSVLWDKWWGEMSQEWFKVEVLQDYSGEDDSESLRAWKAGDRAKSRELLADLKNDERWMSWSKTCRAKVDRGVKLTRLHVVEEPHTSYLDWEIEIYKLRNIPDCGETIFLVPKQKVTGLDLPSGDLMIFDDKRVIVNTYNENGLMTQADFYDAHEGDDIAKFLNLKTELVKQAEPLT